MINTRTCTFKICTISIHSSSYGQKCDRMPFFLRSWKKRIAECLSNDSPATDSGVVKLGDQPHGISISQRKCNSKKNSSMSDVTLSSRSICSAIGISTSGVSISSLNDTKSRFVAVCLITLMTELTLLSSALTGALKK